MGERIYVTAEPYEPADERATRVRPHRLRVIAPELRSIMAKARSGQLGKISDISDLGFAPLIPITLVVAGLSIGGLIALRSSKGAVAATFEKYGKALLYGTTAGLSWFATKNIVPDKYKKYGYGLTTLLSGLMVYKLAVPRSATEVERTARAIAGFFTNSSKTVTPAPGKEQVAKNIGVVGLWKKAPAGGHVLHATLFNKSAVPQTVNLVMWQAVVSTGAKKTILSGPSLRTERKFDIPGTTSTKGGQSFNTTDYPIKDAEYAQMRDLKVGLHKSILALYLPDDAVNPIAVSPAIIAT